ncbi:MAG: FkbM family methyltransferase [Calothrix sp. C42_A2020_038]|nr:FkbM family methyltransferase [Calothrix sp. C42_A2020_038]
MNEQTVRWIISRPWLQPIWEKGLKLCHAGMNVGGGHEIENSGEQQTLHWYFTKINVQDNYCVFDVGASRGEFTNKVIALLENKAKIFCFEPQNTCYEILTNKFSHYHNISILKFALSKENKSGNIYFSSEGESIASLTPNILIQNTGNAVRQEEIFIKTLDTFCMEKDISVIDFLKIDVEGHEIDVLLGSQQMLSSGGIKCIQFEFGQTCLSTRIFMHDFFQLLSENYNLYRILKNGVFQIKNYYYGLEIFKITNFLAIRKDMMHHR